MELYRFCLEQDECLPHYMINGCIYPIHIAVEFGRMEIVQDMIFNHTVDINAVDSMTGYSPLMMACQVGNQEMITFLCQKELKVDLE